MEIPWLSERVRVRGHDGVFIVFAVDKEHETVDLVAAQGSRCLNAVPFADLVRAGDAKR